MIDNWTFGRKIAAGFALSFVLLVAIGAISYVSINKLTRTSQWVTHTHEVLERIDSVLSLLKDAETGQRGYVITGDEALLEPYHTGSGEVLDVVKELRKLTADNPSQQKRADAAEPLIAAKLAELKQTIDLRRKGDVDEVAKIVRGGEGKRFMDGLRRILDDMSNEERGLLKQRGRQRRAFNHYPRHLALSAVGHHRRRLDHAFSQPSDRQFRGANSKFLDRATGGRQPAGDGDQGAGDRHERNQRHHQ